MAVDRRLTVAKKKRDPQADNDGYTALILAACGGNVELVKFFVSRGAALTEINQNGDTALLLSVLP